MHLWLLLLKTLSYFLKHIYLILLAALNFTIIIIKVLNIILYIKKITHMHVLL